MAIIEFQMEVNAPRERVFDLSRSIELHVASTGRSRERVVDGVTRGLLGLGEEVTWAATHLFIRQRLTSRMTQLDRPDHFRDSMVRGAFRRFDHDHFFDQSGAGTLVRERFDFEAPLGPLGRVAEVLFLTRYMRRFLIERSHHIKTVAESEEWGRYLAAATLPSGP